MTTDENVDLEKPVFGSVVWNNTPVYVAMLQLAQSSEVQGRWEKTDSGYRLVGNSLEVAPQGTNPWLVGVWWVGGGIVVLGALWAIRRALARKEKVAAAATK